MNAALFSAAPRRAEVVVKAHAFYLPALAVKAEAVLRRHVNGAYAHALRYRVNLPAACRYGGCEGVEIRRLGRPQLRIVNLAGHGRASVRGVYGLRGLVDGVARLVFQGECYGQPVGVVISCDLCRDAHRGFLCRYFVGAEPSAPVVQARLRGYDELHGAVYSAAGVPSAALLHVVEVYLEDVASGLYEGRCIHPEGVVTVSPAASLLAVHLYYRLAHRAVEAQLHVAEALGNVDVCLVMAFAYPRQRARTARLFAFLCLSVLLDGYVLKVPFLVKRAVDGPVVGHADLLPRQLVAREKPVVGQHSLAPLLRVACSRACEEHGE